MSDLPIRVVQEKSCGCLTLNNPKALHSLNLEMCQLMTDALLAWQHDAAVEFIVIDHADGTRGFCAGGDIKLLANSGASDGKAASNFFAVEYRLNTLIKNYPKPIITLIDGITMGGGVGISVHGTACVATERTVFAMPESGIGLFPDVGGGWFLPRLKGQLGTWLGLTGSRLKGEDVVAAGIATHFINSNELDEFKEGLISKGLSVLKKHTINPTPSWSAQANDIDTCFAHDSMEAILTALEGSLSVWANKQADLIKTKCPQSLKVALRQIREGGKCKTFEDNMRMEYRIGSRIVCSLDFLEGVRAVVVDKDNSPKWQHACVSDVSDETVEGFFEPLGDAELTFIQDTKS